MIALRSGRPEDLANILSWRNARCAVRYSKSGRELTRDEVGKAYDQALAGTDPSRKVLMVCLDSSQEPIGYLRFDFQKDGKQAEISIALSPAFQGKGYGSEALREGCAHAFHHFGLKKITAIVVEMNVASVSAFSKAGFVQVDSDGTFATYELPSV